MSFTVAKNGNTLIITKHNQTDKPSFYTSVHGDLITVSTDPIAPNKTNKSKEIELNLDEKKRFK